MLVLPNFICRLNTFPIKISVCYFMSINKQILKVTWRGGQRPRVGPRPLKENTAGGVITHSNEDRLVQGKNRQTNQWNKTESPGTDPRKHSQSTGLGQRSKATQHSKDSLFNKWCWNHWTPLHQQKTNVDTDFTSVTGMNSIASQT